MISLKFPTEHFLELHSHSVVDLNGTNAAEFDAWVRKKWKQKDHPYRIQIDSLHKDKHPTNSVMRMSAYQIKHPFSLIRYNMPSTNKASAISNTKSGFISDEVIAALVSGFNDISVRSIVFRIGDW